MGGGDDDVVLPRNVNGRVSCVLKGIESCTGTIFILRIGVLGRVVRRNIGEDFDLMLAD